MKFHIKLLFTPNWYYQLTTCNNNNCFVKNSSFCSKCYTNFTKKLQISTVLHDIELISEKLANLNLISLNFDLISRNFALSCSILSELRIYCIQFHSLQKIPKEWHFFLLVFFLRRGDIPLQNRLLNSKINGKSHTTFTTSNTSQRTELKMKRKNKQPTYNLRYWIDVPVRVFI